MRIRKISLSLFALPLAMAAGQASAEVLFQDTFDRPDSTDLNASAAGKSGSLGALTWSSDTFESTIDIEANTLRTDNDNSDGNDGAWAWVDHNFTGLTSLTVSMEITAQSSGGNGRFTGFRVGQSLADISGEANASIQGNAADLSVYRDNIGSTRGVVVFEGATSSGNLAVPNGLGTLSAVLTFADQNAGSVVNYEVFWNGGSVTTGTFNWSGTDENYISVQSNTTNATRIDSFTVEGTVIPEPSSLALIGLGGLLVARRRRG